MDIPRRHIKSIKEIIYMELKKEGWDNKHNQIPKDNHIKVAYDIEFHMEVYN